LILPKKEENKEKSPKIKKPVLNSNLFDFFSYHSAASNLDNEAESFFDQLGGGGLPTQSSRHQEDRHNNSFNVDQQSNRESTASVHSMVSTRTEDLKPNLKIVPLAPKKKLAHLPQNMFE
jgi:hypothetical protein